MGLGQLVGQTIESSMRAARAHFEDMTAFAAQLKDSIKTPEMHLQDYISKVAEGMRMGLLDAAEGQSGIMAEMKRLFPSAAGGEVAARMGAFQQIDLSRVSVGAIASSKAQKTEDVHGKAQLGALKKIQANTSKPPVAVFG